jgi:argininosuccinate lyase
MPTWAFEMLSIVPDLLLHLGWNEAKMRAAIEPSMYATDLALEFALQGMPFRQAYQETAKLLASSEPNNLLSQRKPEQSLAARVSPGAAGNPLLDRLKAQLDELKMEYDVYKKC